MLLNSGGSNSPWSESWSEFPHFMGMGVVPAPSMFGCLVGVVQKVFPPKGVPHIFDAFLTQFWRILERNSSFPTNKTQFYAFLTHSCYCRRPSFDRFFFLFIFKCRLGCLSAGLGVLSAGFPKNLSRLFLGDNLRIVGVLRGNTIRGNTTRNSERKMAL